MSATSTSDLSPEKEKEFLELQEIGKEFARIGKIGQSLEMMEKAFSICRTKKLLSRIQKLKEYMEEYGDEIDIERDDVTNDNPDMVEISKGFYLFHELYRKLHPYQREGIAWMWTLYKRNKGGVLGDDMGLGKTIQIIAFLSGMVDAHYIKHVLIIMPVSLLVNWEKEFQKWAPGILVYDFHGGSKNERARKLARIQRRGGVLLTSYGMIVSNGEILASADGRDFVWDYVILDEGHKIKNPTKTTKGVHDIPSKHRLVLTGTPVQNNLKELWALYDFAHQGTLLGSLKTFKMQYETPITRSMEKDASVGERQLGKEIAINLKKIIDPFFLRRTKAEVLQDKSSKANESSSPIDELGNQLEYLRLNSLAQKNDFIIWLYLTEIQLQIYRDFLQTDAVKTLLMSKKSPLVALTVLKKICDHPRLLSKRACLQLGLDGEVGEQDLEELENDTSTAMSIDNVSDETLINESGKLAFLLKLLENLRETGHRTLLFSLSRKMLDIIQRILMNRQWKVLRIDGTVAKIEDRERRIQTFQKDSSYSILLLTTQVGGVGFTLTAADRVIIYDPSWNPATDAQAVDRAYRIGQTKEVVVYRLITCGSVEEKIYRRQIFKDSITRQTTGKSKDNHRYFSKQELRELFTIDDPHHSSTQVHLQQMHSNQRQTNELLDEHIAYLHSLDIFGISDHDLMFTKEVEVEDDAENTVSSDYIKKRVEMAQHLVQTEASIVKEDLRKAGTFARPFALPVPSTKRSVLIDNYKPPYFPEVIDLTSLNSEDSPSSKGHLEDSPSSKGHLHDHQDIREEYHNISDNSFCSASTQETRSAQKSNVKKKEVLSDYQSQNFCIQDETSLNNSACGRLYEDYSNCDKPNENCTYATDLDKIAAKNQQNRIRHPSDNNLENSMNQLMDTSGVKKTVDSNIKKNVIFIPDNDTSKDQQILSANTSAEIIVSDSDEDGIIESPDMFRRAGHYTSYLQQSAKRNSVPHSTLEPTTVINDSNLEEESHSFSYDNDINEYNALNYSSNLLRSRMTMTQTQSHIPVASVKEDEIGDTSLVSLSDTKLQDNKHKLWRIMQLHDSLVKKQHAEGNTELQKVSSDEDYFTASQDNTPRRTNKNRGTDDEFGKATKHLSNTEFPVSPLNPPQEQGASGNSNRHAEKISSSASKLPRSSGKRIVPLKVQSENNAPFSPVSPFEKAVAASNEISFRKALFTSPSKVIKNESVSLSPVKGESIQNDPTSPTSIEDETTPNANLSSASSKHPSSEYQEHESLVHISKKKGSRKIISDSEESDDDDDKANDKDTFISDSEVSIDGDETKDKDALNSDSEGSDDDTNKTNDKDTSSSSSENQSDDFHPTGDSDSSSERD